MRDLAQEAQMSLSGLYHHFPGKDELLYEIQREAFDRLFTPLTELAADTPPIDRIRLFIHNHLKLFAGHITEMKVLSHEADALGDTLGRQMRRMRRKYYDICHGMVVDLLAENGRRKLDPRIVTMSLFGMINWIYTWYRPRDGASVNELAGQMTEIFLNGVNGNR
jgi:AcrR family transcriptional regulator